MFSSPPGETVVCSWPVSTGRWFFIQMRRWQICMYMELQYCCKTQLVLYTHMHHCLYTCVFPLSSVMPKIENLPGHKWTHKSHVSYGVSYKDITGPSPTHTLPHRTPQDLTSPHRTLPHTHLQGIGGPENPTLKSPTMDTWYCKSPGTVPLETYGCSDRHSMFNHGVWGWQGRAAAVHKKMHLGKLEQIKASFFVQACWERPALHTSSQAFPPPEGNHTSHEQPDIQGFLKPWNAGLPSQASLPQPPIPTPHTARSRSSTPFSPQGRG